MSLSQMLEIPCVHSKDHTFRPMFLKLRMFFLITSKTHLKLGYVDSKSGSQA